jgi:general secretion pathway protein D
VLRQLIPQSGSILSVPGTNAMIVTDRASNVFRLQRLVAQLDQAGANAGVEMITLQNSNASDVVRTLTTLLAGTPADAGGVSAPRIAADDRSNSVLISGDPNARARVISYINNLDKAVSDNDNTEARYLKYARAEDVAAVLKQQASGITAAAGATGGGGAAAAPAVAGPAADRNVTILADKPTNLLIITAPPKTRRALFATVEKMDIARAQVMIEAFIADVSMDKSRNLGVNWAVFSQEDGKVVPGAVFNAPLVGGIVDIANTVVNGVGSTTSIPTGFVGGVGQLKDSGISWAALINAIAADTENNVVAMPTQITADNEEVNLESGQEVPFLTGQYTNSGNNSGNNGNVNPFTTVQRQQIGTKLKITPQLNGSDAMTLTIDLESSELAGQSGDAGSAITNVRKFHNVVLVKDQQTIVVGGLIRDAKVAGETRVPFLGRIPILGNLFKYRTATRQKSNLMVFIRPTVLTDSLQASLATNEKYKAIREAQQAQGKLDQAPPMLPFDAPPLLPATPAPGVAPVGAAPQTSPVP